MSDPTLFDNAVGPSHHTAPPTSPAAAVDNYPRSGTQRRRVFDEIKASGDGMTDEEVQDALGMGANTQRPRRVELVQQGLVVDSGSKRRTRSGNDAVVWVSA